MLGAFKARARALQRQLPLRRRGAPLPARRRRREGDRVPVGVRADAGRGAARAPRADGAAPGRRRLGGRAAPRRGLVRGARSPPRHPTVPPTYPSPDDLYILYTGRNDRACRRASCGGRRDIFVEALGGRRTDRSEIEAYDELAIQATGPEGGLRAMLGAAVHARRRPLDELPHLAPRRHRVHPEPPRTARPRRRVVARSSARRCAFLLIVGDAFARPLLDELDAGLVRPVVAHRAAVGRRAAVGAAEARVPRPLAGAHRRRRIGVVRGRRADAHMCRQAAPRRRARSCSPRATTCCRRTSPASSTAGDDEIGWLAKSGRLALGYLGDAEKTARTYPTVDGVRYSVPGDRARLRADDDRRAARPRLGDDQLRRREDLRRGGRGRVAAPPRGVRRRGAPAGRPSGGARRSSRSSACAKGTQPGRRPKASCSKSASATSPGTSCRRRSCSSTRSCAPPPARPTTAGPAPSPNPPDRCSPLAPAAARGKCTSAAGRLRSWTISCATRSRS